MKNISHKKYLEDEARHHDKTAKFYTIRREKDFIWEVPEEMLLFKNVKFSKNETVIDMGCGPCVSIKNIIPRDILQTLDFIGVDISQELLKFAKKYIPNGKFIKDDIETISFKTKRADKIISLGALHHAENKSKTLQNWLEILKPGGFFLMREPTYEALRKGSGESPGEEGVKIEEVMEFIRKNKIKLVKLQYFNSPAFHFFNKVMIKLRLGRWQENKGLWYPIVFFDALGCSLFSSRVKFFRGESFIIIMQK